MIRIFKVTLTRRESGLTLEYDVLYFLSAGPDHEQCNRNGERLSDPVFTISLDTQMITEITNPEEFGLAKHESYPVISNIKKLQFAWVLALTKPQTVFTCLPINVFSDQFFRETL